MKRSWREVPPPIKRTPPPRELLREFKTWGEWQELGYAVCKGSKSHSKRDGRALFGGMQVTRIGWRSPEFRMPPEPDHEAEQFPDYDRYFEEEGNR